jgi:hypothetical protein
MMEVGMGKIVKMLKTNMKEVWLILMTHGGMKVSDDDDVFEEDYCVDRAGSSTMPQTDEGVEGDGEDGYDGTKVKVGVRVRVFWVMVIVILRVIVGVGHLALA